VFNVTNSDKKDLFIQVYPTILTKRYWVIGNHQRSTNMTAGKLLLTVNL
jgi:hypothetical protein